MQARLTFLWRRHRNVQLRNTPSFHVDAARPVSLVSIRRDTSETEELVRALGNPIVGRVVQLRSRPEPGTFVGSGKLKELRDELARGTPLTSGGKPLVVVDAALKPPQLFGIEDIVGAEVWDRIRVILEIFQQKAQVKEARLQVELARLRYELPFVHEALHRTLTGEHPGFMGGGELPMRAYETHLKSRTKKIQDDLVNVRKERAQRRAGRRKSGFQLVAIAGYTNSGKSSLLNALCGSAVRVEDVYFSTLETTTRRLRSELLAGRTSRLLFTDTVGLIRDLPPWLIDAFGSTLEEIVASDVVLLAVDASEDAGTVGVKLATAWALLDQLHAPKLRLILFNKADLLTEGGRHDLLTTLSLSSYYPTTRFLFTSTKTKEGLEESVRVLLDETRITHRLRIHLDATTPGHLAFESWLRDHSDIDRVVEDGTDHEVLVRCSPEQYVQIRRQGKQARARVEELPSTGN